MRNHDSIRADVGNGPDVSTAVLQELARDGALHRRVPVTDAALRTRLGVPAETVGGAFDHLASAGYTRDDPVGQRHLITITSSGAEALGSCDADPTARSGESDVALVGSVVEGMGKGRHFVDLPGYKKQFRTRLGYVPYPGTLNVELREESLAERSRLSPDDGIPIDAWTEGDRSFGAATCYPIAIETEAGEYHEPVDLLVPDRTGHDERTAELLAPTRLRSEAGIDTGSELTIHVR